MKFLARIRNINKKKKKEGRQTPEDLEIPLASTSSVTDTEEASSPLDPSPLETPLSSTVSSRGNYFTPVKSGTDNSMYRTSKGQCINISYEALGLTPTGMEPVDKVLIVMEEDDAWNLELKNETQELALIIFVYAKGYYKEYSKQERICSIRRLIRLMGGNQTRLKEIAFSNQSDRIMGSLDGFSKYFCMATTARIFFAQNNAKGGFPGEAIHRRQSSCNCYIPTACMFVTVKLQRDNPHKAVLPIDTAFVGRRYIIDTIEGLEDRVIRDKGSNAVDLVKKMLKQKNIQFQIVYCDHSGFRDKASYSKLQQHILNHCLDMGEIGIVSTFHVCANFRKVKSKSPEQFGYWKFDGNSIDCQGEFVTIKADKTVESERTRLFQMWNEQGKRMAASKKEHQQHMAELIGFSPRERNNNVLAVEDTDTNVKTASEFIKIVASQDDTIAALKRKAEDVLNVSQNDLVFKFNGRDLNKLDDTLQECEINHLDVVEVKNITSGDENVIRINFTDGEPTHAMILLGYCTELGADDKYRRLYMLWNWWAKMPLVLVSYEYLVACRCQISFLPEQLTTDCVNFQKHTEALACDCSFPDHGEDTLPDILIPSCDG